MFLPNTSCSFGRENLFGLGRQHLDHLEQRLAVLVVRRQGYALGNRLVGGE